VRSCLILISPALLQKRVNAIEKHLLDKRLSEPTSDASEVIEFLQAQDDALLELEALSKRYQYYQQVISLSSSSLPPPPSSPLSSGARGRNHSV
jgi:hypothetical protein